MSDRRTMFQRYMKGLDPTAVHAETIADSFYVDHPDGTSARIAARLEIDTSSSHLVVGGVGTGKSTELFRLMGRLEELNEFVTLLVDVGESHRLDRPKPSVLLALTLQELLRNPSTKGKEQLGASQLKSIEELLFGKTILRHVDHLTLASRQLMSSMYTEYPEQIPGILERPTLTDQQITRVREYLRELVSALGKHVVILFDGLDRLSDTSAFVAMVRDDVPQLSSLGIGSVVVGPQRLRFATERDVVDSIFSEKFLHGAQNFESRAGKKFLSTVLVRRVDDSMMSREARAFLVQSSGGLLRDLIALAKRAGFEAYQAGADSVSLAHVKTAVDRFGRDLLLGLTIEKARRLRELAATGIITISTPADIELLMSRLIVEVCGAPIRYVLHPTIAPLVAGLPES